MIKVMLDDKLEKCLKLINPNHDKIANFGKRYVYDAHYLKITQNV